MQSHCIIIFPGSSSLKYNPFPTQFVSFCVFQALPRPLQADGSLIFLFFCPPRASDSGEPTLLLFLYHLPRQLCLLASSGPVPQPHLRCPSASGLADLVRERIPKPPHLLQVLELVEGWALRTYSSQGPGSPPDRFVVLCYSAWES